MAGTPRDHDDGQQHETRGVGSHTRLSGRIWVHDRGQTGASRAVVSLGRRAVERVADLAAAGVVRRSDRAGFVRGGGVRSIRFGEIVWASATKSGASGTRRRI